MASEQVQEKTECIEYSYYPGCSLHGTALEYDTSVREVAHLLDIHLVELPDWNCCGASSAHMTDHELAQELAARNVRIAEQEGRDLIVPCAACFHRIKASQKAIHEEAEMLGEEGTGFAIYHISELLRRRDVLEKIRKAVNRPLKGLKLVPYYGCLITRPPSVTGSIECEDPKGIDLLIKVLSGEPKRWSYKTECCGGSLAMPRPDITRLLVSRLIKAAVETGAQGVVTMCPMCQANLDSRQLDLRKEDNEHPVLPVFFATELVEACTAEGKQAYKWKRHLIDPGPILNPLGL